MGLKKSLGGTPAILLASFVNLGSPESTPPTRPSLSETTRVPSRVTTGRPAVGGDWRSCESPGTYQGKLRPSQVRKLYQTILNRSEGRTASSGVELGQEPMVANRSPPDGRRRNACERRYHHSVYPPRTAPDYSARPRRVLADDGTLGSHTALMSVKSS